MEPIKGWAGPQVKKARKRASEMGEFKPGMKVKILRGLHRGSIFTVLEDGWSHIKVIENFSSFRKNSVKKVEE